jgi:glucuronate isomerase
MTDVETIFHAILGLPARDRLLLVERVVHTLVDASTDEARTPVVEVSPLGLFADEPDAVDEMMEIVMEMRRQSRLRGMEDDDVAEGSS